MELEFYKAQYNRQCDELKEAYINLNKQKLTDSEEFRQQLNSLQADRSELQEKLTLAEIKLAEIAEFEAAARDRISEISKLNGQIEAREREVSTLHVQIQNLQSEMGQKQVLEAQLNELRGQLKEASATITNLQAQQVTSTALQVDRKSDNEFDEDELVPSSAIMLENETLHADIQEYLHEVSRADSLPHIPRPGEVLGARQARKSRSYCPASRHRGETANDPRDGHPRIYSIAIRSGSCWWPGKFEKMGEASVALLH
jgi:DNA repair exonuclease SbcCD ATPase subunit